MRNTIVIVDFGSQTTHLIARRIRDLGALPLIVTPDHAIKKIKEEKPQGVILSGGPASVCEKNAPQIDKKIFSFGIPILGICYGFQLTAKLLGGKVVSGKKEYGPAEIKLKIKNEKLKILQGLSKSFTVWMSHGDSIVSLPEGFAIVGSTEHVNNAFAIHAEKKLYMLQFHPEAEHTENGLEILQNFLSACGVTGQKKKTEVSQIVEEIRKKVGDAYVIGAISGGVDSTVAGVLTAEAVGKKFIPVYVENGLMRKDTERHVNKIFIHHEIVPIIVHCEKEMLKRLKDITDSEQKRKIIGSFYIEIFEREMRHLVSSGKDVRFLLQGTIYSDVIESKGTKHASKIKSHHNVGGLPKNMKLQLLEPLRNFYKDEVRNLGKQLELPDEFIYKQPFPGPGYSIRIRGEVTRQRLEKAKQADAIILEELEKANLLRNIFISFPVLTDAFSTAVKGDGRFFGEVICLRIVQSQDVMTATWAKIPYDILQKISSRIVNEVPEISRVVYDITTKPPATMEWE